MTIDSKVKQLVSQAETSLRQVLGALVSVEPGALASGQQQLVDLVEILSQIERAARKEPTLQIRESLLAIRTMLKQSRKLSSIALVSVARQMETRSLFAPGPSISLCVEG